MGYAIKQSQTAQPLLFLLISSTNHISGLTGVTPAVTISKNGGAFATPAGSVTEVGNGWYAVAGNATDSSTLGPLILHATGTGADPCDERFDVVAFDPQDVPGALYASVVVNTTTFRQLVRGMGAILLGKRTDNAAHTSQSFADVGDPVTPRVNSANDSTTRTPTLL